MIAIRRITHRWLRSAFLLLLSVATASAVAESAGTRAVSRQPFPVIEAAMHTNVINRIAVDAAGRYAVTASHDKTARAWDLRSGQLVLVLRVPVGDDDEGKLYAVALSPDGRLVALGGFTGPNGPNQSIYLFAGRRRVLLPAVGGTVHGPGGDS